MIETGVKWIKTGLNFADYVPFYEINSKAGVIRIIAAITYIGVCILKFTYHQFYLQQSDAKKIFDHELSNGGKHFLRGLMGSLQFKNSMRLLPPLLFAAYDFNVTTQPKKEK